MEGDTTGALVSNSHFTRGQYRLTLAKSRLSQPIDCQHQYTHMPLTGLSYGLLLLQLSVMAVDILCFSLEHAGIANKTGPMSIGSIPLR